MLLGVLNWTPLYVPQYYLVPPVQLSIQLSLEEHFVKVLRMYHISSFFLNSCTVYFFAALMNLPSLLLSLNLWPQKCMRFNPDATLWVAKQRILCTLNQSLKDVLNYGLFQPAINGRDGKFLDEERIFREYPQPISKGVPSLEVQ